VVSTGTPGSVRGGDDAPSRFDAVQVWHAYIHENDGGFDVRVHLDDLGAVGCLADDFDVRLVAQDHPRSGANEPLVIGEENSDGHLEASFTGRWAVMR
jgi:hypothetical protein